MAACVGLISVWCGVVGSSLRCSCSLPHRGGALRWAALLCRSLPARRLGAAFFVDPHTTDG